MLRTTMKMLTEMMVHVYIAYVYDEYYYIINENRNCQGDPCIKVEKDKKKIKQSQLKKIVIYVM